MDRGTLPAPALTACGPICIACQFPARAAITLGEAASAGKPATGLRLLTGIRECSAGRAVNIGTNSVTCNFFWSGWPDLNRRPLRPKLPAVLGVRRSCPARVDVGGSARQPLCGLVAVLLCCTAMVADPQHERSCLDGKPSRTAGSQSPRSRSGAAMVVSASAPCWSGSRRSVTAH
jgi:hypothetical protein